MENPLPAPASTFLHRGLYAEADTIASLHLKRDHQIPILLREQDDKNEGYDEGKVTNTRFGSFPHSTLINVAWGSQIRASLVDTGSRGRRGQNGTSKQGQKRKRDAETLEASTPDSASADGNGSALKAAMEASTGFVHLLPPTPESWTTSLPHRTQVLYTPDYSYILQRLRARPGTTLIEAGAGSGSFTHAAARAVFNGYTPPHAPSSPRGKVWSFEFHSQRVATLQHEIQEHSLSTVVETTHRDVCEDGFCVSHDDEQQVRAQAVFLDLPAPWLALPHLIRSTASPAATDPASPASPLSSLSPLDPTSTVRICTFSPCIEQVTRTVSALRAHGWLEISMVELAAKRIEVRRERVGLQEEGLRGVNATPATVEESLEKLMDLERRARMLHPGPKWDGLERRGEGGEGDRNGGEDQKEESSGRAEKIDRDAAEAKPPPILSKQQRLAAIRDAQAERKLYLEGRLVHRTEPELKTHTSYLVFAVLPRAWDDGDEAAAAAAQVNLGNAEPRTAKSRRQVKREAKAGGGAFSR